VITLPIAERVDSSASGNLWVYLSSAVRADACRIRACMVLMSALPAINTDAK
jgi:hypothetical protein